MFRTDCFRMTAKTLPGLEEVLAGELASLGAEEITPLNMAAGFSGGLEILYAANLRLRTALRVLVPVAVFNAQAPDEIYAAAKVLPWEKVIGPDDTIAVDASVSSRLFGNPGYTALKVKDAVADRFAGKFGRRPSVDSARPVLRINLRIEGNACVLSLDSSGESLHRRGYRLEKNEAPLSEALAAGLLLLSGWTPEFPLFDPLCGSGTFLAEAGLMAENIPPGALRKDFGFMRWKGFRRETWAKVTAAARDERRPSRSVIWGSDKDPKAVEIARSNLKRAGLSMPIRVECRKFEETVSPLPEGSRGFIIMNPPYGKRLEEGSIAALYTALGDTLKKQYSGYTAWIFTANADAAKSIGLRPFRRLHLANGPLDCRFLGFELFKGTKKADRGGENE